MMNYKLIKVTEGYIIVSDKPNNLGGWHYDKEFKFISNVSRYNVVDNFLEIIASTFIPELPNINFNDLEEEFGIDNADKLLKDEIYYWYNETGSLTSEKIIRRAFSIGLSLNKDKLYTAEDLIKAIEMARILVDRKNEFEIENILGSSDDTYGIKIKYQKEEIIKSLQPKTEWDIEIEMETKCYCGHTSYCECEEIKEKLFIQRPKIINNKIKIINIK